MSGLGDKLKGSAKQAAGKVTGDDKKEAEGKGQKIVGNLKDQAEDMKHKASEKVNQALDSAEEKTRKNNDK